MSTHRYEPTRKCRGRIGIVGAAVIAASRRICQNSTDSQKPVIRGLGERAGARDIAAAIVEPVARDALADVKGRVCPSRSYPAYTTAFGYKMFGSDKGIREYPADDLGRGTPAAKALCDRAIVCFTCGQQDGRLVLLRRAG